MSAGRTSNRSAPLASSEHDGPGPRPSRRAVLIGGGLVLLGLSRDSSAIQNPARPDPLHSRNADAILQDAQARLGEALVSVKEFGARGDGRAIDSAAINRAIERCRPGQTLFFPPGTYLVDNSDLRGDVSTEPLARGVNLLMSSEAWLKRAPREENGVIFVTCAGDNVVQVNVDGDEYPGSMTGRWASAQGTGVFMVGATNVVVANSRFRNLTFGVQGRGLSGSRIVGCDFRQFRNSGCLMQSTASAECSRNQVIGCNFERMGDTAVAFLGPENGREVAHNVVANCSARNTQYLANGFAFDVEGGFRFGVLHHNSFIANTVEQVDESDHFQGGLTMNQFSEDGSIVGNRLIGNLHSTNDCGIAVPGTRNMVVADNVIERFRGQGVHADGAVGVTVQRNRIRDCGSSERPFFSAVLLAETAGSADATVVGNEFDWSPRYPFAGPQTYAVAASVGSGGRLRNVIVRDNVIRTPSGGILIAGTAGSPARGAVLEGNVIEGTAQRRAAGSAIRARYVEDLSVRNNRIAEVAEGIDVTGSRNAQVGGNSVTPAGRPRT